MPSIMSVRNWWSTKSFSGSLNVSWEIDLFGRVFAAKRATDADVAAAAFDYYGVRASLAAQVADAYFQARGFAIQLADAEETVRIRRQLYDLASRRAERGLAPSSEADRVAGDLAQAEAQALSLEGELKVQRRLLLILAGRASEATTSVDVPETTMLFVEFHGSEEGVKEQAERFGEIAAEFGGGPFDWATKPEDRSKLWQARHDAYWAARALRPGAESVATDVCVPISRLAECVDETKRDIEASGLIAPIVGHVGDGNFHTQPLVDLADPDEVARCEAFIDRLVKRALAMEGTCTGEHGVGQKKKKYLAIEHSPAALDTMRLIKRALDPRNILNPGKIIDL